MFQSRRLPAALKHFWECFALEFELFVSGHVVLLLQFLKADAFSRPTNNVKTPGFQEAEKRIDALCSMFSVYYM